MQAVILAGGRGKRLRPLTATRPKALLPVLGRPLLSYLLELLFASDFRDITLTLDCHSAKLKEYVEHLERGHLQLRTIMEEESLGNASGVRKAMQAATEPFLVLYDGVICDFNLKAAMNFHKAHGAKVTMLCTRQSDPRECELVKTNADGMVSEVLPKPDWSAVNTDLVNTGIYILEPSVLSSLPKEENFDFAKDLFPLLLKNQEPIAVYEAQGYWCDITESMTLLRCQKDFLEGKTKFDLPRLADGIFAEGTLPKGDYTLLPPVYIGADAEIGKGAILGPYTVLSKGATVGAQAKIRESMLLEYASVSPHASMHRAILAENAVLESSVRVFENAVIGAKCRVHNHATIAANVKVWPGKSVERGTFLRKNLKYSETPCNLFAQDGLLSPRGTTLEPEQLAAFGRALAASAVGQKIGIGYEDNPLCRAAYHLLAGAITAQGGCVWNFGAAFLSEMYFFTAFCAFPCGVFLKESHGKLQMKLFAVGGLPLPRNTERAIEQHFRESAWKRITSNLCKEVTDMSSLESMYIKMLVKEAGVPLSQQAVLVQSENPHIRLLLSDCLYRAEAKEGDNLSLKISPDGTEVSAFDRACGWIPHARLLSICCIGDFENGHDVALPFFAPHILSGMAGERGRRVLRYVDAPLEGEDSEARALALKQLYTRDALLLSMRLLGILERTGMTLAELNEGLPPFYERETTVSLPFVPTELLSKLQKFHPKAQREGISLQMKEGYALLVPLKSGKRLRIFTECESYEASKELTEKLKERLTKD